MAKNYLVAGFSALFLFALLSCSKENKEAKKPTYIIIPEMYAKTNYSTQGTSNQKITTVWLVVNKKSVGAFELPLAAPVILNEGENQITFYEGISMNGVNSSRAIYDFLAPIDTIINYSPSDKPESDTIKFEHLSTEYEPFVKIDILEDFDNQGLKLEKTDKSDTNIIKNSDSSEVFVNLQNLNENNKKCGVLYTTSKKNYAEVATVDQYTLPGGGSNVYLELNYKSNVPLVVGVIVETTTIIEQLATVRVNPKSDWNKIYINLVNEVSKYANNPSFKIFFTAEHQSSLGEDPGFVFMDNIKLVYIP